MAQRRNDRPRGLLNSGEGRKKFTLARYLPGTALASFLEHYWIVRWDLTGQEPYISENLPYPSVHIVFEKNNSLVYGVMTGRFSRRIEGAGAVLGIKFRPGGFYPFVRFPVARIVDASLPLHAVLPVNVAALERRILSCHDDNQMVDLAEGVFRERLPEPDQNVELVNRIIASIVEDRSILRVEDLSGRTGMSRRSLQRLFNRYVGVSPKWVIARYRLFEAAEILAGGDGVDLGQVAADLGYFDQAHFIKDFKRMVGTPPARYARESLRRQA